MSKRNNPYVVTPKDSLENVIKVAKRNGQPYYIGAASDSGQSAQAAARNRDKSGHHADLEVKENYGFKLNRVNHTRLMKESNACNLEAKLIAKHGGHPLCQNKKQGQDGCLAAEQGITYVRTYIPKGSSAAGSSKKRGTTKRTTKRTTKGTTKGTSNGTKKRSK